MGGHDCEGAQQVVKVEEAEAGRAASLPCMGLAPRMSMDRWSRVVGRIVMWKKSGGDEPGTWKSGDLCLYSIPF